MIENNRDWHASPFLDAYETILEAYGHNYKRDYRRFDLAAELDAATGLVYERQLARTHTMAMPCAAFIPWSFTSTKMQNCIRNVGEETMRDILAALVARYFAAETAVEIPYTAELTIAKCV